MKPGEQAAKTPPERDKDEMNKKTATDKYSEGAMQAGTKRFDDAYRIASRCLGEVPLDVIKAWSHLYGPIEIEKYRDTIVTIIDEETRPEWIPCAKQMPTEDHGDIHGKVIWRFDDDGEVFHFMAHWDHTNSDGIKRIWDMYEIECVSWMSFPPGPKEG